MKVLARGLLAALVWLAVLPAVAGAHATIVRVTPADRSVVAEQPGEVTLRWSEPVDLGPDSVRLLDASGRTLDTPKAAHIRGDRTTAAVKLPAGLKDGTYVVAWRVTSADSAASRWNAIRWAPLGPTPGSRPSSSMRFWMTPSYTPGP